MSFRIVVPLFFIPPFSLLILLGLLIFLAEDVYYGMGYLSLWLFDLIMKGLSYRIFIFISSIVSILIGLKVFLSISLLVGNLIDVYFLGLIAVLISSIIYINIFGLVIFGVLFIIFLSTLELFLFILGILESFSSLFQSLTLSNRLSINMICGSLLTSLLCLFCLSCGIVFILSELILMMFLLIVFSFEILNSLIQLFIFLVLSFEYLIS